MSPAYLNTFTIKYLFTHYFIWTFPAVVTLNPVRLKPHNKTGLVKRNLRMLFCPCWNVLQQIGFRKALMRLIDQFVFLCVLVCLTVHHWPFHCRISLCLCVHFDSMTRERADWPPDLLWGAVLLVVRSPRRRVNGRRLLGPWLREQTRWPLSALTQTTRHSL